MHVISERKEGAKLPPLLSLTGEPGGKVDIYETEGGVRERYDRGEPEDLDPTTGGAMETHRQDVVVMVEGGGDKNHGPCPPFPVVVVEDAVEREGGVESSGVKGWQVGFLEAEDVAFAEEVADDGDNGVVPHPLRGGGCGGVGREGVEVE